MAFPGERFVIDLDNDNELAPNIPSFEDTASPFSLIGEIQERAPTAAAPPAPKPPTGTGFPEHKKRFQRSAFKQRRTEKQQQEQQKQGQSLATGPISDEKKAIDEENRRQLASLSDEQIQQEREELMSSIDPGLLERFLRRAVIDEPEPEPQSKQKPEFSKKPTKSVSFDVPEPETLKQTSPPPKLQPQPSQQKQPPINEDLPPPTLPSDLHPASELPPSFHFPTPPPTLTNPPPLDPSSSSFLSDLQTHYFPNTPHDPSSLNWLQPEPSAEEAGIDTSRTSPYDPESTAETIHPAAIRFSLTGTIIAPSTSLSLPTTLGLHHHGSDPQAAGYTIPELAILGRSSFPAQRCVAWQILGRILYRLGRGEFGERGSPLVEGMWEVVEKEGAVAIMLAEADGSTNTIEGDGSKVPLKGAGIGRHASATAWAVEGVWLWQKSGGGDRGVLKEGTIRPR
ncbi:RPAP1 family protein [Aspergillus ruber CBS 135680]|uniref:RPAP1-like protein n=1 Tax=Aspergillus ruber (strain CBS 135680) TaxID=1388766 RepID=A0A017SHW9_ASPRC|nr:uncharacterized protein EURHEDRAFT_367480 [Aspergillus ruber CBS 135680]EYE96254.1 hypothetical protein EURHEDRAFT_367480 [Aspergillus ruber CBS 135680]